MAGQPHIIIPFVRIIGRMGTQGSVRLPSLFCPCMSPSLPIDLPAQEYPSILFVIKIAIYCFTAPGTILA